MVAGFKRAIVGDADSKTLEIDLAQASRPGIASIRRCST